MKSSPIRTASSGLNQWLNHRSRVQIYTLALILVAAIAGLDFFSGYEVSVALLYLIPVSLAGWYAGRNYGVTIAIFSCVAWYVADRTAGSVYSHPAIPIWNATIRFGFFVITSFLLTSLRKNLEFLRGMALLDTLTGLYRRHSFEQRLKHDLALLSRRKGALTLAYLDLDNFKHINDSQGHAEGDKVLRTVGLLLNHSVRKSDTAARLGGDEFALVLPDMDHAAAERYIHKLHDQINKALHKQHWDVSCSIGVVTVVNVKVTSEQLVAAADKLMYDVKKQGKDAVAFDVIALPPAA